MEIIYLLVPLAVLIAAGIVVVFLWAVKSGQFDDLEGPAHRILMDDEPDRPASSPDAPEKPEKRQVTSE
jgi:cbb3-type cytochrome oxidase maturation protein